MNDDRPVLAALWMLGAVVSFTSMAVAGREMSQELDTFEIMMYRSFLGVVIVLVVGRLAGTLHQIRMTRLGLHLVRNLSHFAGQNLWFYAVTLIPFAQLFAFEFSVPLIVALLAPVFLAERLTPTRIAAASLGFAGILIVARPWEFGLSAGIIAAALCAFGFAGSFIATKILARYYTTTCILFWLVVMQSFMGLAFAGYDGDIALPSAQILPLVILVGCAGLFAHFCITTALQLAPAIVVAPLDFVRLPLIAIIGMAFYSERLDLLIFLGAILIFGANYMNIWTESRARRTVMAGTGAGK